MFYNYILNTGNGGEKMKKIMIIMVLIFGISLYFLVVGMSMHEQVSIEEDKLHILQNEYYSLDKSIRDGAPSGSELNKQLVEIQQYPSELLRLKLVGVGKILTGIYALLLAILLALIMMPIRLAMEIKKKK